MSGGIDGGPAGPAESFVATVESGPQPPNPVSTEREPVPEPKAEPKKEPTAREALQRARDKVEAASKEPAKDGKADPLKAEGKESKDAKAEPKRDERQRAEHGHFAPKDGKPAEPAKSPQDGDQRREAPQEPRQSWTGEHDPPQRFTPAAKEKWATTDPEVRAEVNRAVKELTQGFEKYKGDAEAHAELKDFHDLAAKHGTTVKAALTNYTGIEALIAKDPIAGFERVAQNMGLSLRQIAEAYLGRAPDQFAAAHEAQIREARQVATEADKRAQQLEARVRELEGHAKTSAEQEIAAFSADKPRFEELKPVMGRLLTNGLANDLSEAYAMAERLKPAAGGAPAPDPAAATAAPAPSDPTPQTRKGEKSITGAPGTGSDPGGRRASSSSIREALRRAEASAG